ncbi:MAG: amylo-alpha-1,6-glucosidase [Candidatus Woesearchaeota archaeon]
MRIIHKLGERILQGEGNAGFLLSNKKGGYLSLNSLRSNISAYQGWFNSINKEMYKLIENISLDKEPDSLKNHFSFFERHSLKSIERFHVFNGTFVYEVENYDGQCSVVFDVRKIYDFSDKGRIYKIYRKDRHVIIEYAKFADDNLSVPFYKIFIAVSGIEDFENPDKWLRREYSYDRQRNSKSEFYVYHGLKFSIKDNARIFFSFSDSVEDAVKKTEFAEANFEFMRNSLKNYAEKILFKEKLGYNAAIKCLDDLTIFEKNNNDAFGIYAGFPWFFQFWARDELISLGAYIVLENYDFVKKVLYKYLGSILSSGRIPNRVPSSELGSADAIGWLAKRFNDFIIALDNKGILHSTFSNEELEHVYERIERAIIDLKKNSEKDGLIWNAAKETWIDTDFGGDTREGACIEIQALQLSMYSFIALLGRILKKKE